MGEISFLKAEMGSWFECKDAVNSKYEIAERNIQEVCSHGHSTEVSDGMFSPAWKNYLACNGGIQKSVYVESSTFSMQLMVAPCVT